jgi:SAM-dependent MidA family methyltransferase
VGQPLDRIRREIDDQGPITFARFMELALYGAGGFYEHPPVGADRHFVTNAHVHPVFGELLARAVRDLWESLGMPRPFRMTEVGAGDGTLARSLLANTGAIPVRYTAVERSPGALEALAELEDVSATDRLAAPADLVMANELLDNLPFRLVRGDREVRVGREGDRLVEVLAPIEREVASRTGDPDERVDPVGAFAFIDDLARVLDRGYALLIDYGGLGAAGGPVHGYRDQALVEDVLTNPGTTDITAGVDFDLIAERAVANGLVAFPTVTQRDTLVALGLGDWLRDELGRQRVRLESGEGREAVATWSGRNEAMLLVDPSGLGRLRWLVLATPGLDPPRWLNRAAEPREA